MTQSGGVLGNLEMGPGLRRDDIVFGAGFAA